MAVTIEVLGPLVLAVVISRRTVTALWAVVAFAGAVAMAQGGLVGIDPIGVCMALGAAACWALYIICNARTGVAFPRMEGLALAMAAAAILSVPSGVITAGPALLNPVAVALGLCVALPSTAAPNSLELMALRRISPPVFSILSSSAPAVATLAGLVLLGQNVSWVEGLAVALVVSASMGAIYTASPRRSR